jgi:hypothetical protein
MRPRIKTAFLIVMFLLTFTGSVSAEIFFGPELYYRTKGGPDIYTDNFDASVGEATLRVSNGDPDGGNRVSSASVYLNENLLVKRENFKQGTHVVFEEAVDLAAVNDIRVELRGAPESFVTIDIFRPGLSVRINCIPDSIYAGQDAVLSWTSSHADSLHIDNGIGYVEFTGSLTVSPDTTTTYTVTAIGPEGSVTDQVTLQVFAPPAPEIIFSASATEIAPGESATLTWTTLHADTCELVPGFGPVALNGSKSVTPERTTTYTLTATGPGGTASASVMVTVASISIGISITSPQHNDMISGPTTMVQGAIANPFGNEVGIMVNGIAALVDGNQFAANHVPLVQGENIITAMATDVEGNTAEASVLIDAAINDDCIGIVMSPQMGVSPFEATLMVDGAFPVINPDVWGAGPGNVEISDGSGDNEFNIRLTTPGLYFLTAEATDDQGHVHTDSVAVLVVSEAALDALLQRKWNEMKSALADGDIDEAVKHFSNASRSIYHHRFTALSSVLDQVAGDIGPIAFVESAGDMAVYDLITIRDDKIYSYQLVFIREEDGIWRIYNF